MKVEIEFPDADITSYDEATFSESLSAALGVDPSRIQILSVRSGSIIVDFVILPAEGETTLSYNVTSSVRQKLDAGTIEVKGYGSAIVKAHELPAEPESSEVLLGLSLLELAVASALVLFVIIFLAFYWKRSRSRARFLESKLIETDHLALDPEGGLLKPNNAMAWGAPP